MSYPGFPLSPEPKILASKSQGLKSYPSRSMLSLTEDSGVWPMYSKHKSPGLSHKIRLMRSDDQGWPWGAFPPGSLQEEN